MTTWNLDVIVEEGKNFHVKANTNRLHRFIKRNGSVVKYSAFIVLSTILLAILIHTNVDASATQHAASRQQVVQSSQRAQVKQQKTSKDNGFSPAAHAVVPTSTPTPAIASRGVLVPGNTPAPVSTPTPTPVSNVPVSNNTPVSNVPVTGGSVTAIINQVFGANAPAAMKVAQCESGLNPAARNPYSIAGSYATGLFQILYPSTWSTTPQASLSPYDATANAQAAYAIFARDGYSWREWSCAS